MPYTAPRSILTASVFTSLMVALIPIQHTLAAKDNATPQTLLESQTDLAHFWKVGMAQLAQTPPSFQVENEHELSFIGLGYQKVRAYCNVPDGQAQFAVVYLTDAAEAEPPHEAAGCAQFVYAWRQGQELRFDPDSDTRDHPLYTGTLNACELARIACGINGISTHTVGLVGEGYGGAVALCVAALMPDRVSFVVAHQPICLRPELFEARGGGKNSSEYARATRRLSKHLNARNMAPYVRARALLTVGTEDPYATPASVTKLYEALQCPKLLWPLRDVGHCSATELPNWEQAWQHWAFTSQSRS